MSNNRSGYPSFLVVTSWTFISNSVFLFLLQNTRACDGASVLFYTTVATSSHNMVMHPLATELANRGHTVTYLSSIKVKMPHPEVSYFYPREVVEFITTVLAGIGTDDRKIGAANAYTEVIPAAAHVCRLLLESEEVKTWIEKSSFDIVVINACFNECGLGLAHKFGAPHIIVQTAPFAPWQADLYGIPVESSLIPDFRLNYTQDMNFFQRVYNTAFSLEMYLYHLQWHFFPLIEGYMRESLGRSVPDVNTMLLDTRLVLVNSYFAAEYAHSLPPLVVPVGGLHCPTNITQVLPQVTPSFN